ncbi:MAG: aminotransferase class I/II-fold pyridoxal phosphate-dependent enzyme, partial [Deltaproteobacteria bacterium]|nr:aminotransferase class I/II-fold pyridoxal phosphate-dependent enzyme [Deltaproteobacteria bacterium]
MQSQRLNKLPPYLFAELDRKKKALLAKGADLIDLSIGDPDIETPPHIVKALRESVGDKRFHRYPPYNGIPEFREAAAQYMKKRFNASIDV